MTTINYTPGDTTNGTTQPAQIPVGSLPLAPNVNSGTLNAPITSFQMNPVPGANLNGTIPAPTIPSVPPPITIPDTPIQTENNTLTDQLIAGLGLTAGKAADTLNVQNDANVVAKAAEKKRLADLYNTSAAAYDAAVTGLENSPRGAGNTDIRASMLFGQQGAVIRQKATDLESINAQYQVAVGNYDEALKSAQRIVDLKYAPIEEKNTILTNQLAAIAPLVTKADKKQYDAQVLANEKAKQDVADAKQQEKDISSIFLEATKSGATPEQQAAIKNAKTVNDAIMAAGSSLVKPNTETVKLDNGNTILIDKTIGKVIKNFGGGTGGSNTSVSSVFNGLVDTVAAFGNTDKQRSAIKTDLQGFISNQDFNGAYNYVANNVENSLTGTTKTTFADSRVDYEVMSGLKQAVQNYASAGGDTGLLKGTVESIERKLGQVTNPKLAALAVELRREFQSYRVKMTGAAFSPAESRDYDSVNPSSGKTLNLNLSVIDGAMNQLKNRVDSTIRAKVPQASDLLKVNNAQDKDYQSMEADFGTVVPTSNSTSLLDSLLRGPNK